MNGVKNFVEHASNFVDISRNKGQMPMQEMCECKF